MKTDLWMPLYVGDYLKDTLGLSRAEHGSYMLLIMAYWAQGKPLMDDNAMLREIARCPESEWTRTRSLMLRFFTVKDGLWTHKRIDIELIKARNNSSAKSKAGKIAAEKRWHGGGIADASLTDIGCVAKAARIDGGCSAGAIHNDAPSPSPSPSPLSAPSPSSKNDKASAKKLSESQKYMADKLEQAMGEQWINDAGKWIRRIQRETRKAEKVINELIQAVKDERIKTTPAQYAEQMWKEFK